MTSRGMIENGGQHDGNHYVQGVQPNLGRPPGSSQTSSDQGQVLKADLVDFRGPDWRKSGEPCLLLFPLSRGKRDRNKIPRKSQERPGESRDSPGIILGQSRENFVQERSRKDRGKIEEDRGKIEEDWGNCVFFSVPCLGKFRDAGVFRNFWAHGLCGWTAFWGQVSPLGA